MTQHETAVAELAAVEVCVHNGWLVENCGFDCDTYEQAADAVEDYRAEIADLLRAVGFEVIEPAGTCRTYHGWQRPGMYKWRAGPVATRGEISHAERQLVWTIVDRITAETANKYRGEPWGGGIDNGK